MKSAESTLDAIFESMRENGTSEQTIERVKQRLKTEPVPAEVLVTIGLMLIDINLSTAETLRALTANDRVEAANRLSAQLGRQSALVDAVADYLKTVALKAVNDAPAGGEQ